jgi:four helix bundle protein
MGVEEMSDTVTAVNKGVRRFEDLIAWQKARQLTAKVYAVSARGGFARDYALRDQIRRAAVSVMSNIAEGFDRNRASEFHQFLSIAKGSCAELRSQLYVAYDANHIDRQSFEKLLCEAVEVAKVIGGLRSAVERRRSADIAAQH